MKTWGRLLLLLVAIAFNTAYAVSERDPIIAVDSNGNAVAVWIDAGPPLFSIKANTRISGVWGTPKTIMTGGTHTQLPVLAVNAVGLNSISAIVAWADKSLLSTTALYTAMLPTSFGLGLWTPPLPVSLGITESVESIYSVRANSNGSVVIIYDVYDTFTLSETIQSTTSIINSFNLFSAPTIISP